MGRFLPTAACTAALILTCACNRADEAKAKQEARDLSNKIQHAVNSPGPAGAGSAQTAEQKLKQGSEDLRAAGEKAGVKLDKAALIAKVKTKLATDVGLSTATSIDVDVRGGVVTLKGSVSSEGNKHQAEESVKQLEGVTQVVNDLIIKP